MPLKAVREVGIHIASDDLNPTYYYRKVAREERLPLSSWTTLSNYLYQYILGGTYLFRVSVNNYNLINNNEYNNLLISSALTRDRTLVLTWDIEIYNSLGLGIPHIQKPNFNNKPFIRGVEIVKREQSSLFRKVRRRIIDESMKVENLRTLHQIVEDILKETVNSISQVDLSELVQTYAWKPDKDNKPVQRFISRMRDRHTHEEHKSKLSNSVKVRMDDFGPNYSRNLAEIRQSILPNFIGKLLHSTATRLNIHLTFYQISVKHSPDFLLNFS
jgi:hypothetical protein